MLGFCYNIILHGPYATASSVCRHQLANVNDSNLMIAKLVFCWPWRGALLAALESHQGLLSFHDLPPLLSHPLCFPLFSSSPLRFPHFLFHHFYVPFSSPTTNRRPSAACSGALYAPSMQRPKLSPAISGGTSETFPAQEMHMIWWHIITLSQL